MVGRLTKQGIDGSLSGPPPGAVLPGGLWAGRHLAHGRTTPYTRGMPRRHPKAAHRIPLHELIDLMQQLERATGAERVRLARHLSGLDGPTLATIQAAGDEGVMQAKAASKVTDARLAQELGYASRSGVTDAVWRHKERLAGRL